MSQPKIRPLKERQKFHDLVSSRIIVPLEFVDQSGVMQQRYLIGEAKQAVAYLESLRHVIRRIAKSSDPPWREDPSPSGVRYIPSEDAKALWRGIMSIQSAPWVLAGGRKLTPYLDIGVRLASKWEPRIRAYFSGDQLMIGDDYYRRVLKHLFRVIRQACGSTKFKAAVTGLKAKAKSRSRKACKRFLEWLAVHAKLLVMRADLYFELPAAEAAEDGLLEQAVEKFIRNLREGAIVPGVLWYAMTREYGYARGIHFHLLVVLDGDKHRQAYVLTEKIKNHWIYNCVGSDELASGFNCYKRKDEYEYNGLGLVHYTDLSMLMGIRRAIEYMTKTDGLFMVPERFARNLQKGLAPRPSESGKRRGAPRKHGYDVSLARKVLLGSEAQALRVIAQAGEPAATSTDACTFDNTAPAPEP